MGVRVGVAAFFLCLSISTDETNTFQLHSFIWHENCERLMGVRVGVAYPHNKLALKATEYKSEVPIPYL